MSINILSRMVSLVGVLLGMSLSHAQTASSFGNYQPAKLYTEQAATSFYLPMRDGVRLAVRVVRPAQAGKPVEQRFPVIWHHTLSTTQETNDGTGPRASGYRAIPELTAYGYVVVQVARRGNGQSFGSRRGYHDRVEAYDAYEVNEWLAAQPWSTGVIGMYGCSNTGDAALHAMTVRPPHLKAVFAGCFSWNKYDAMRRGGIFAQWGTGPQRTIEQDMEVAPVDGDADKRLLRQAAEEHQQSTVLFDMWKAMPYRDSWSSLVASRFWSEGSTSSYADQLRSSGVALYIQGAWFDEFRDQGLVSLLNIPGSKILIGPWKHCENPGFTLVQEIHRFFDYHLKGVDTGITREPRIHYYTIDDAAMQVMSATPIAGAWRTANSWPVSADSQRWYPANAQLSASAPQRELRNEFVVNTQIACPDAGSGSTVQPCHVSGAGVSFPGQLLKSDVEVTGSAQLQLQVSADRRDANLFAYLEDVAPDGSIKVITEGRLKASLRTLNTPPYQLPVPGWHRAYREDETLLVPGEAVTLQFEMLPTSYVFRRGHRIQLTVTGADHRERARDAQLEGGRITLLSSSARMSYLDLPVRQ